MATILLGAVGAALGGALGGAVLGVSSAIIGRAVGATVGRLIDQRLLGNGSDAVETGRLDHLRLTGAREGAAMARVYGRMRVGGQVIWATRFKEHVRKSGGGKGAPSSPKTKTFSYSISLAIGLGKGEVQRVGRIWANGREVAKAGLNLRVYSGDTDQLPDPKIEAVEGQAPAFRGLAYVVFEDLDLTPFGNRVPQFSFEVFRTVGKTAASDIQAVALIPGTGEYTLATTPVHYSDGPGANRSANVNSPSGETDLTTSLADMRGALPKVGSVSLVASWFGNDLRAGSCTVEPKVEQVDVDGSAPWSVNGVSRAAVEVISRIDDRPVFGGTPSDASVIEAIAAIHEGGQEVMFYPFVLMDIQAGNGLPDPWSGSPDQPVMPWRGRITASEDGTVVSGSDVAAFFGEAAASDFATDGSYTGPAEWSYRRFVLHYAHLCAAAGGVEAFCVGSELRGLTRVRDETGGFPAVAALRALVSDVRGILGADVKLGYAADWSEYFGYHPDDGSGDLFFNLDELWGDGDVDFVGIDNYMPLADWRNDPAHLDEGYGSTYDLSYLQGNVAGGEGFDWYYPSAQARDLQQRAPITDGAYGEDWVFRYKDLRNWWGQPHHERLAGVRQASPTDWVPQSKPIWFTELGCPAVDKGANQPNVFIDPKSSESSKPYYSNGLRDDIMQIQYLRATFGFWGNEVNNPVSSAYGSAMVDMARAHVWAWDARPWPAFPDNRDLWSDGENYARGHWINGRVEGQPLAELAYELCAELGSDVVADPLFGNVAGYLLDDIQSARASLQPLMLAYGFDAAERDGILTFAHRGGASGAEVLPERLVWDSDAPVLEHTRLPDVETAGRVRLDHVEATGSYQVGSVEVKFPDDDLAGVSVSEIPLALTRGEARSVVERWLAEARVARDVVSFSTGPSEQSVGAGDVVTLGGAEYRVDRVEDVGARRMEAVRVEASIYQARDFEEDGVQPSSFVPPVPVYPLFMDLPLVSGTEVEHAPHIAVAAMPWPGTVAVYGSASDDGYELNRLVEAASLIGVTQTALFRAEPALWDNGVGVEVRLLGGELASASRDAVLNGANIAAIGGGSGDQWEVFQFANATLIAPDTYHLTGLLRGQAGSDGLMPDDWPVGSQFVLLDGAATQIELAAAERDLARHYRVGPAQRGYDDPSYVHEIHAFSGAGLRPYAPCQLRVSGQSDLSFSWVRRTRIDGDSWSGLEVPLGETSEQYLLRVIDGASVLREVNLYVPNWTYTAAMQMADGVGVNFAIEVAQVSERYGAGLFGRIEV